MLYHAGVPGLSGGYVGVDVFFVISGFLVTTMILGEHARTGAVRIVRFYARRIRRLLPMAALVLVCTIAAVKAFVPPLLWPDLSTSARWTAAYLGNYRLAADGTNYLASDSPTPFQHYWSLAVEEQFYLLWPLLLVVGLRLGRRWTSSLAVLVGLVTAGSFVACLLRVASSQPYAFFSLPTRAWELGVGGVCALAATTLRRPGARWATVAGWLGLALIAAGVVLYGPTVTYPGWATLAPVLGTAAVLLAGRSAARTSWSALLGPAPMQWLGRVSYSLYLWHWPVLVLPVLVAGEGLRWPTRAALVVGAVLLAHLSERFVERPVRTNTVGLGTATTLVGAGGVTVVALVASAALALVPTLATSVVVPATGAQDVARGVVGGTVVPADVTPALIEVSADLPAVYRDGCHLGFADTTARPCRFGAAAGGRHVMLLGDSHAAQWFPALETASTDRGWRLTSLSKSACPMVDATVESSALRRPFVECETWKQRVIDRVWAERPDLVVLSAYSQGYRSLLLGAGTGAGNFDRSWAMGLTRMLSRLPPGTRVVVLGDSPEWPRPPVTCLSGQLASARNCERAVPEVTDGVLSTAVEQATREAGARYVPTVPWLCSRTCPAIVGNVVVYRDRQHVTATFSRLLATRMATEVLVAPTP